MNNNLSQTKEFFKEAEAALADKDLPNTVIGLAIPAINLLAAKDLASNIKVASQNVHHEDSGAYTGEISVDMLVDTGVEFSLVGHSERRKLFKETNEMVNTKVKKLIDAGITPIFCLGETEEEYVTMATSAVVKEQIELGLLGVCEDGLKKVVIAYEPIWAIGTGKTATPEIAQTTILIIRNKLAELYSEEAAQKVSILYGGSVKPSNIKDIMSQPDIDGALVGGASVQVGSFVELFNNK